MQIQAHFNYLIVLLMGLMACGSQEGARMPLPGKVGASGELIVVTDKHVWEGELGDTLRSIFGRAYAVLPQYEPEFDLVFLPRDEFDRFWKPHRNIIDIDLGDRIDTQDPSVEIYRDRFASGQLFVAGKGKNTSDLALEFHERRADLLSVFHREEVNRFGQLISLSTNDALSRDLADRHGVMLILPKDAQLAQESEDFVWIDRQMTRMKGGDNHDVQQGIFIYFEPYVSDTLLSMQARIRQRNAVLRRHVEGPTPGSYMTTELRYHPTYEEVAFKGEFASELRGLWRVENDYMGGPFYSLTTYDAVRGRLVTVEGYSYAPYFDKREYMREIESVVQSLTTLPLSHSK